MFELCEVAFDSICTFEFEFADCWLADDFVLVVAGGIVLQGLFRFKRCVEMPLRNALLFRWGRFWAVQSIKIFPRGFWRRLNLCWSDIRWNGLINCCYRSLYCSRWWWCSRWYRWFRCGRMCWCFSNKKIISTEFHFFELWMRFLFTTQKQKLVQETQEWEKLPHIILESINLHIPKVPDFRNACTLSNKNVRKSELFLKILAWTYCHKTSLILLIITL